MPKEYVHDEQYGFTVTEVDSLTGGTVKLPEPHVVTTAALKVTWGRDAYVQAAVVTDEDRDGMEAQHLSLDRAGINTLIRVLRKARDQAYGADA